MNLQNVSKQELVNALCAWNGQAPGGEEELNWQAWVANFMFVKMLGANEALYLVAINDDEGANLYEDVAVNFARLKRVRGKLVFAWVHEWEMQTNENQLPKG